MGLVAIGHRQIESTQENFPNFFEMGKDFVIGRRIRFGRDGTLLVGNEARNDHGNPRHVSMKVVRQNELLVVMLSRVGIFMVSRALFRETKHLDAVHVDESGGSVIDLDHLDDTRLIRSLALETSRLDAIQVRDLGSIRPIGKDVFILGRTEAIDKLSDYIGVRNRFRGSRRGNSGVGGSNDNGRTGRGSGSRVHGGNQSKSNAKDKVNGVCFRSKYE